MTTTRTTAETTADYRLQVIAEASRRADMFGFESTTERENFVYWTAIGLDNGSIEWDRSAS